MRLLYFWYVSAATYLTNVTILPLLGKQNERWFGRSQTVCYLAVEWTKETLDAYSPGRQRINLAILAKTCPTVTNPVNVDLRGTNTSCEEPRVNGEPRLTSAEAGDSDNSGTGECVPSSNPLPFLKSLELNKLCKVHLVPVWVGNFLSI